MEILERDIFDFIFYPDSLERSKYVFLLNNDKFKAEIGLLTEIINNFQKEIPSAIIKKINNLISAKKNPKIIRLYKNNNYLTDGPKNLVLAADSPKLSKKQSIETFEDKDSKYLIKIITNSDSNKVFLFNKDNEELQNIKLNLEPSGQSFIMETSNKPIIISPKQDIANISLVTNN